MKSKKPEQKKPSELRKRAEEKLKSQITPPRVMSDKETQQLIHELQVHQIELEMQNEELRNAQSELEESRAKYSDLYDFAPVSYFIFDKQGLILETNLTAAKELGIERNLLINKPFRAHILNEYRNIFDEHLKKVFLSERRQTCEIKLKRKDGSEFYAQLKSIAANDLKGNTLLRTSVIDITERKKAASGGSGHFEGFCPTNKGTPKWWDVKITPIMTHEGKVDKLLAVSRDITKRKKEEEALQKAYTELEQKVKERTKELQQINESLQREITEVQEALSKIAAGDPRVRIPEVSENEMIIKLNQVVNKTAKEIGAIVDQSHEFAIGLAEHFDVLHRVSKGELSARIPESSQDELLEALGKVTNQMIESVSREITEHKRTEDKLKKALNEWRITFDSTSDLIMLIDSEMNIIKANLATTKFLQKSINEILGKKCFQLFHGTDKPPASCPFKKMKNIKKNKEAEFYLSEMDIWLRTSFDPIFDNKGNITGYVHIIRDITERKRTEEALKESEERYRTIIEQSADCIYLADIETKRILEANQSFQHLLGYGPDEIKRLTLYDFVIHEKEDIDNKIEQILKDQRFFIGERCYLRKDGTQLDVEVIVSPISYQGKSSLCGVARNITNRKQTEQKLLAYQEQLRSLASKLSLLQEQERRRIAIDLHDHISQSLALCKIKLGTLQESASSNLTNPLEEIRNLIEQTIQYTRSLTFDLSPPILYELGFESAVASLGEQILRKHGILFNFKDDGQPKPIKKDTIIILFQVVRELLVNIVKHAHADKASMSICKEGDSMLIHIEDDGVGFDVSKTYSFLSETDGFGIFSIRERLNYIGGQIEIKSEPGRGTHITIVAPLKIKKK